MATVKKLNGNYVVQTPLNATSNITLDTDTVYIKGNLTVLGAQTALETINSTLSDNIIILNDGETGTGVTLGTAGISIDRGLATDVTLRWNETHDKWQITNDGINYSNIASSSTGLTAIVDDIAPRLGGNLITNGFNVQFQSLLTANPPTAVSGNVIVYADTVGSAGSGLFVVNSGTASDELVTKAKAIVYSIIL